MTVSTGFEQFVGPISCEPSRADMKLGFTIADHHLNGEGNLHGGMMMTLANAVLDQLVRETADGAPTVPLSLNCDFVGPARAGAPVTGTAEITRRTRTVLFVSAELRAAEQLIMTATGVYRMTPKT